LLHDILIFQQIADLKMAPLNKNVIQLIADFPFQIFFVTVVADLFFKIFMVMVIADHWTSYIFCVAIGPQCKNQFYN
jgi:hypothetical protein